MTADDLKNAMNALWADAIATKKRGPDLIMVEPKQYAMMKAASDFAGRNHRRIKREMNKAWRSARKFEIANPPPSPSPVQKAWHGWRA